MFTMSHIIASYTIRKLENTCSYLKVEVTKLKSFNATLQEEVSTLRNAVKDPSSVTSQLQSASNQPSRPGSIDGLEPTKPNSIEGSVSGKSSGTYADVVARSESSSSNIEDILRMVHVDLMSKDKKRKNIVISGLQPSDQHNDDHLVHQLLFEYWKIPLTSTITTKRLCRDLKNGRVQPVLVNLPDETTANTIIDNALILRKSLDATIRSTVFVNRDLTKGERLAAFELRQKRRKSNEQCSKPIFTSPPQISYSVGAKPVSSSALSLIPGPSRLAATAPLVSSVQPPIPPSSDPALPSVKA